jgi:two-component system response regulator
MSTLQETTIVMVDDNEDEIFLTRRLVRREGILNRFVSEKKPERIIEAFKELETLGVGRGSLVVLLDINMPRQNGFETLRVIRSHADYKDTPVIMLSASKSEEDMVEAERAGANGYIAKPFTSKDFFAELQNVKQIKKKILSDSNTAPDSGDIYARVPEAPPGYPLKERVH